MNASSKVAVPKPSLRSEPDNDVQPAPTVAKPGLLPTGLSRAIVIAAVIFGLAVTPFLFVRRYELTAVPQSGNALAFRLNTFTGAVSLCSAGQCTPVSEKSGGP